MAVEGIVEKEIERLRGEYERVGHQRVHVGLGERLKEHVAHEELERVHHVADHEHEAHDDHEARDVLDLARRFVATGLVVASLHLFICLAMCVLLLYGRWLLACDGRLVAGNGCGGQFAVGSACGSQ